MQYISILEQPTKEAVRAFAEKRNLTKHLPESYQHPQEDYLSISDSLPIFVVSDGVTLDFKKLIETDIKYPNPSPAGDISKIFCDSVIQNTQEKYDSLSEEDVIDIFRRANNKVGEYNKEVGKSDISGNMTGFYASTGAFVIIKDTKTYWVSICNAFVAHFDKDMNKKFMSSGSCSPYAVINGEERMADHLEHGIFELEDGDRIFVFTDGFEHYMKNDHFLELFKDWNPNLKERITKLSESMNLKDPEKYGHERSLISILI